MNEQENQTQQRFACKHDWGLLAMCSLLEVLEFIVITQANGGTCNLFVITRLLFKASCTWLLNRYIFN